MRVVSRATDLWPTAVMARARSPARTQTEAHASAVAGPSPRHGVLDGSARAWKRHRSQTPCGNRRGGRRFRSAHRTHSSFAFISIRVATPLRPRALVGSARLDRSLFRR